MSVDIAWFPNYGHIVARIFFLPIPPIRDIVPIFFLFFVMAPLSNSLEVSHFEYFT